MRTKKVILALAALSLPASLAAQDSGDAAISDEAADQRYAIAEQITLKNVPDGSMADVIRDLIGVVADSRYIPRIQDTAKARLSNLTGLTQKRLGEVENERISDAIHLLDPDFTRRNEAKQASYDRAFNALLKEIEPAYRQGLAKAYAERYTETELRELLAFFSTSTGAKYAAEEWEVGADDPVLKVFEDRSDAFQSALTAMGSEFREIGQEYPRGRQFSDLNEEEQKRLSGMLGISTKELLEEEPPSPLQIVPAPDPERERRIRNGP